MGFPSFLLPFFWVLSPVSLIFDSLLLYLLPTQPGHREVVPIGLGLEACKRVGSGALRRFSLFASLSLVRFTGRWRQFHFRGSSSAAEKLCAGKDGLEGSSFL